VQPFEINAVLQALTPTVQSLAAAFAATPGYGALPFTVTASGNTLVVTDKAGGLTPLSIQLSQQILEVGTLPSDTQPVELDPAIVDASGNFISADALNQALAETGLVWPSVVALRLTATAGPQSAKADISLIPGLVESLTGPYFLAEGTAGDFMIELGRAAPTDGVQLEWQVVPLDPSAALQLSAVDFSNSAADHAIQVAGGANTATFSITPLLDTVVEDVEEGLLQVGWREVVDAGLNTSVFHVLWEQPLLGVIDSTPPPPFI
jgi:hypothetical protein